MYERFERCAVGRAHLMHNRIALSAGTTEAVLDTADSGFGRFHTSARKRLTYVESGRLGVRLLCSGFIVGRCLLDHQQLRTAAFPFT